MIVKIEPTKARFKRVAYRATILRHDGTPARMWIGVAGSRARVSDWATQSFFGYDGRTVRAEAARWASYVKQEAF